MGVKGGDSPPGWTCPRSDLSVPQTQPGGVSPGDGWPVEHQPVNCDLALTWIFALAFKKSPFLLLCFSFLFHKIRC